MIDFVFRPHKCRLVLTVHLDALNGSPLDVLKINLIIILPRLSIKYPVPAGHLMVSLALLLASQVYIPASLKSSFKSENTCPLFQSLFSLGFRSVKTANAWRLCRRDTETSSSLVEQSITSFWPMYPFKTFCGCFAKARGSKRSKAQFRIRHESPIITLMVVFSLGQV